MSLLLLSLFAAAALAFGIALMVMEARDERRRQRRVAAAGDQP